MRAATACRVVSGNRRERHWLTLAWKGFSFIKAEKGTEKRDLPISTDGRIAYTIHGRLTDWVLRDDLRPDLPFTFPAFVAA